MNYAELAKEIAKMTPKQRKAQVGVVVDGEYVENNLTLALITEDTIETLDCITESLIGTHILT